MFNFNECKTSSAVKTKVREIALANLLDTFIELYGEDNVSIVGNNEIAVCCGTRTLADGTEGEVCFTVKPVAKDFDIRRVATSGKVFQPYERIKESEAYEVDKSEKERKAEERARQRAENAKKDKERRAKKKAEGNG